jgi:hypothetical protein
MEVLCGKHSTQLDGATLRRRIAEYSTCLIDLGTGDGRFVRHLATQRPAIFVIGVDACREQLRASSRSAPPNALFLIANALALPAELEGLATHLTINFPWGSLLAGLLAEGSLLPVQLFALMQPGAQLELRLNGGALAEQGWSLEAGAVRVRQRMHAAGFDLRAPDILDAQALHAYPTTWAKRLAFGRDPRAVALSGARLDTLSGKRPDERQKVALVSN